ncbi:hypothetical protein J2777_001266 [Paraburkholderia graminis]|uniref:hypothetical protein n=1 Tax=Paraburkholderia graminis TaxID=60548 RepID=UPI00285F1B68|nr:hypothetical protein [Paraburkholderia graminis]MDR6467573.1 hypothetical protein [Paraburkholderia graminis]
MLNATDRQIVFNVTGHALNAGIYEALLNASQAILRAKRLESLDLNRVTTRAYVDVSFPKFIKLHTLECQNVKFDEAYVQNAFEICMGKFAEVTVEQFYSLTLSAPGGAFEYKKSYGLKMPAGASLFLVALHCSGCITLPFSFSWPRMNAEGTLRRLEVGASVCSELLAFLRTLDSQATEVADPAFLAISNDRKGREYFLTYGTKLLLATGWHRPEDVDIQTLLALKRAEHDGTFRPPAVPPYRMLLDVLSRKYGAGIKVSASDWSSGSGVVRYERSEIAHVKLPHAIKENIKARFASRTDADILEEVMSQKPGSATPHRLKRLEALPGLSVDCPALLGYWLRLEELFLRKTKRESGKGLRGSLGYFNIYLFYYLPYWFDRNHETIFPFPDCPNKLVPSLFISRLLDVSVATPLTFMELMDAIHENRDWSNNSYYALLVGIEQFFAFIVNNKTELPNCEEFRQPMSREDYPRTSRGGVTSKPPIPAKIFGAMIEFVEAIRFHLNSIQNKILLGESYGNLPAEYRRAERYIDTFECARLYGECIPFIYYRGKTIPLRYIPNFLLLKDFRVKIGEEVKYLTIPQPHALNQILCALFTGVRHNHLQWLDAKKFDSLVFDELAEFVQLYVNTDKQKTSAWSPHVNMRVIEVLREQKAWRELIAEPGFAEEIHYNNNPDTKWPKFLPLFSAFDNGAPHHDSLYERAWTKLLAGIQSILPELGSTGLLKVCQLVPPGVVFNDPLLEEKRQMYGKECDRNGERVCELRIVSNIVPHSCRVSVVSQFLTFLPANIIGKNITGQTEAVVHYYGKFEPEYLELERTHQSMKLRTLAAQDGLEALTTNEGIIPERFIQADRVNSRFAQSLRANVEETIVSYGCISIVVNEDDTSGLDILRETRGLNAAENKTEICPYGNQCPQQIIIRWKGPHRCGLCHCAVRSVDHLPAVSAKVHAMDEELNALTNKIETAMNTQPARYSEKELDRLEEERFRISEELAGWMVSEGVLETTKQRLAAGLDSRRWVVQQPEIVSQDLKRIRLPSNLTSYVLMRLQECIAYPSLENPEARARFDALRRTLLVRAGKVREAVSQKTPISPAAECVGLLRTMVDANSFTAQELVDMLEGDESGQEAAFSPLLS